MKKNKNTTFRSWPVALESAVIWQIVLFVRLPNTLWTPGIVMSWFVRNGLSFYKDFDGERYFPLTKLLTLPLYEFFGDSIKLTIYIALAQALITLLVVYKISLIHLSKKAASIAVLFYSIWFGFILKQNTFDHSLLIGLFTLLMLSFFYKWIRVHKTRYVLIIGFIASLAFCSLQMSIVPIAVIFLYIFFFSLLEKKNWRYLLKKTFFPFMTGFIPVTIAVFSYFAIKRTLPEFIEATVLYYLDPSGYPFSNFNYNPRDLTILLFLSLPLYLIGVTIFFEAKKKYNEILTRNIETWKSASLFILLLIVIISIFFAIVHPRRYLYILPLLSFTAGLVYDRVEKLKNKKLLIVTILTVFSAIYVFSSIIPWYIRAIKKGRIYEISNISQPGDYVNDAVNWLKGNSSKDAKIHVFGPMMLYYEAQRLPANNRTYSALPWTYEPFEETKILFTKTPADYWLVDERLFKRFQNWGYEYQSVFIRELLDTSYEKIFNSDWMSVYEYKKD